MDCIKMFAGGDIFCHKYSVINSLYKIVHSQLCSIKFYICLLYIQSYHLIAVKLMSALPGIQKELDGDCKEADAARGQSRRNHLQRRTAHQDHRHLQPEQLPVYHQLWMVSLAASDSTPASSCASCYFPLWHDFHLHHFLIHLTGTSVSWWSWPD